MDAETVAQAHANGIGVNIWTVDDPDSLASWKAMGVDKICTNCPALMLAAKRS
jgi:glycerophosphoryl diester phosphodiesterase